MRKVRKAGKRESGKAAFRHELGVRAECDFRVSGFKGRGTVHAQLGAGEHGTWNMNEIAASGDLRCGLRRATLAP